MINIIDVINQATLPKRWFEEGLTSPNKNCKEKTISLCERILKKCHKKPDRIAPSKEGGIYIAFDSSDKSKTLWMEVYNDLEITYLLNDNLHKIIIDSGDFKEMDEIPFDKISQLDGS